MTRVLVIDDSELVREAAAIALELAGWDAVTVPDGEAGVQAAATQVPDGVLLDVEMPGIDGVETLRRLRADPRTARVPVAFLTPGARTPATARRCWAPGAGRHRQAVPAVRAGGQGAGGVRMVAVSDDTADILRRVWARRRGDVLTRVDAIDVALAGDRDEQAREEGRRQAHMLAGSAGTFGFPEASAIARELERTLQAAVAPDDAQRAQAGLLRRILEGEPQT